MTRPTRRQNGAVFRPGLDFASQESVGARSYQEDYSRFNSDQLTSTMLAVLADGVGGNAGGQVASKTAVDSFIATFCASPASSVPARLGASLNQANTDIGTRVSDSPALEGMGCTLIGVHIGSQGLQWISVGDSALFLFRKGQLSRLNADHSMKPVIDEAVRQGKISQDEASRHPDRNSIRSAVTGESLTMIDMPVDTVPLKKGDVVILASDGLLTLTEPEIAEVLSQQLDEAPQTIAIALIKAVTSKRKPRQDNTTVQVIVVPTSIGAESYPRASLWWSLVAAAIIAACGLSYQLKLLPRSWPSVQELFQWSEATTQAAPTPVPVPAPGYGPDAPVMSRPASAAGEAGLVRPQPAPSSTDQVRFGARENRAILVTKKPPLNATANSDAQPSAQVPANTSSAPKDATAQIEKGTAPATTDRTATAKLEATQPASSPASGASTVRPKSVDASSSAGPVN